MVSNKTWWGRFKKNLDPVAAKINSSLLTDYILHRYELAVSVAHLKVLSCRGIINKQEEQKIITALKDISDEIDANKHELDDIEFEDIHLFIEHLLIEKLGDIGKGLRSGRSRNEQISCNMRMYLIEKSQELSLTLNALIAVLSNLSDTHKNVSMPSYTHLQQAQPIALSSYFMAYVGMLTRDLSRVASWKERANFCPYGAGAISGSLLSLDREFVAKELGFAGIIENTIDAISDRDFIIEWCFVCSTIMVHMSRLCEDMILWQTSEFGFISIDDSFCSGSAFMPNKKNPVVFEVVRGKSGRVFGSLMEILTIMKAMPMAYNKDMQEDKGAMFNATNTTISSVNAITFLLKNVKFNTKLMEEKATSGFIEAGGIVEGLVLKGVPFRDAQHIVGLWISQAAEKNGTIKDVMIERAVQKGCRLDELGLIELSELLAKRDSDEN
ncbi:argininosuccinate lyase [Candidatus Hydrogenosomobacter endosymbioticus]|uniref:Argininosuccinate lyase n=1 Tax=Candidatus Hydrogenosomobacter endosymbioticus TaxID=2558174 RepID=A0ABM7V9T7_9PROT|nr:argininosuccinate lyase [Candidatus Hydrogenosomobacter endosymbioticus]BDB96563.1 argininosuccinate lyase [Candidatus Hydrogenosomobacter endosymbioticus]